jgi:hypothetical protein
MFKHAHGRPSVAALGLLAPYLLGARVNVWHGPAGTCRRDVDGVWLGRYPTLAILAPAGARLK